MNNRLLLLAGMAGLIFTLSGAAPRAAEGTKPEDAARVAAGAPATNPSLSAFSPGKRARWQERLTLGPGDVLNFGLFDSPELARTEVVIGPDGRVSYLQAEGIMAAGLTIDGDGARFILKFPIAAILGASN